MSPTGRWVALGVGLVVVLGLGVGLGALLFGDDSSDDQQAIDGSATADGSETTDGSGDTSTTSSTTTEADDGDPPPASPTTTPTDGLEGDALAFAEALNRARDKSYHARYEGQGALEDGTPTDIAVEVWRRLPLARRDFTIVGGGEHFVSREYLTDSGFVGCLDTTPDGIDDFQCGATDPGSSDPAAPAFGAVDPHGGPVTAEDNSVTGVSARCYRVTPEAGPAQEVCFDGEGIPVVVDDGELRLRRTVIDSDMTADDFTPPSTGS